MRVVFIHSGDECLGIEYLSAALKNDGHQVALVFDAQIFQSCRFSVPGWHDKSLEAVAALAIAQQPDMVCFSVVSDYFRWSLKVAERIKRLAPVPVVFGGIHPTAVPEHVLAHEAVDYVCVGEGEAALVELARALQDKVRYPVIPNICFRKEGVVHQTPVRGVQRDLDRLAFPDKGLFYRCFSPFASGAYTMMTGRGCACACTYCHNGLQNRVYAGKGAYRRRRSVESVILELEQGLKQFDFKRVFFCDDIFIDDKQWLAEFARLYPERIGRPFCCNVHPACVDEETVALLVKSGCTSAIMGMQALDEKLTRACLRRTDSEQAIIKALDLFRCAPIFLYTGFIFGIPGQDVALLEKVAVFCASHKAGFHDVFWLRYYPGTEVLSQAAAQGVLTPEDVNAINSAMEFRPFSHGGHSFSRQGSQLRNLVLLGHFMPGRWVAWFVQHKVYRWLPAVNLTPLCLVIKVFWARIMGGNASPYTILSFREHWQYYCTFLRRTPVCSGY